MARRASGKTVSLKPRSVTSSPEGHGGEEFLDGFLELRHHGSHAAADVDGRDQLERDVSVGEVGNLLRPAILEHAKRRHRQPAHIIAAIVGHRHGDLYGVDVLVVGEGDALGPQGLNDASAGGERRDDSNLMLGNGAARIPPALERRGGNDADLTAVDEEDHRRRGVCRIQFGTQRDLAADVRVRFRREDGQPRRGWRRLRQHR